MSRRRCTIDISWVDRKLQKICASDSAGRRRFGDANWTILKRRLGSLAAAATLKDMHGVPGRCHQLTADRQGQFAVHLWGQFRLIFTPNHDPVPVLDSGGPDLEEITRVSIEEVVDYHGK